MKNPSPIEDILGPEFATIQRRAKDSGFAVELHLCLISPKNYVDLSAKQAAIELAISPHTVKRYYHQGRFPNAYALNARVIRIPWKDVQKLKESRWRYRE